MTQSPTHSPTDRHSEPRTHNTPFPWRQHRRLHPTRSPSNKNTTPSIRLFLIVHSSFLVSLDYLCCCLSFFFCLYSFCQAHTKHTHTHTTIFSAFSSANYCTCNTYLSLYTSILFLHFLFLSLSLSLSLTMTKNFVEWCQSWLMM